MQRNQPQKIAITNNRISIEANGLSVGTYIPEGAYISNVSIALHEVSIIPRHSTAQLISTQRSREGISSPKSTNKYTSLAFDSSPIPPNVFRGGIEEYMQQYKNLKGIEIVQITGAQVGKGVYDSSIELKPEQFKEFLMIINEQKVKQLGLTGCTLSEDIGKILGSAIKDNTSLEKLAVTSNQLGKLGLISILNGLKENHSLKSLYSRSYNMMCYLWSVQELQTLKELINTNKTLEKIELPNNQIGKAKHIAMLTEAYKNSTEKPAEISGFILRSHNTLPEFNKENALNGKLDECTHIKFINRY